MSTSIPILDTHQHAINGIGAGRCLQLRNGESQHVFTHTTRMPKKHGKGRLGGWRQRLAALDCEHGLLQSTSHAENSGAHRRRPNALVPGC